MKNFETCVCKRYFCLISFSLSVATEKLRVKNFEKVFVFVCNMVKKCWSFEGCCFFTNNTKKKSINYISKQSNEKFWNMCL